MNNKNTDVALNNRTIAKLAYLIAKAQELSSKGEVIGPSVRKLMEAGQQFDTLWKNFGYED